jgi:predicted nucleotidyltransferase
MNEETSKQGAEEDRFAPYVAAWRRRWQAEEEAVQRRRSQALAEAERAARMLVERYGVRKVVLFGSLAWGRFQMTSDVDLAADGLAPERFFRAAADLSREISVPIDLKLISDCPPVLRRRIAEEGMVLFEG